MNRRRILPLIVVLSVTVAAALYLRHDGRSDHYTGFVEGEERILRSEVAGRLLEVRFAEGDEVPANEVVAVLDSADIDSRIRSKKQELAVLDADLERQQERIRLVEETWNRDLAVRQADLRQTQTAAEVAERTFTREKDLVETGASTAQRLDDGRAARDQARSTLDRARQMLARTKAEERTIALARRELDVLRQRRELVLSQITEVEVTRSKYEIRSPPVRTVVQTQFLWPGELAQPGTSIAAVLDPTDKYVQIYIPVSGMSRVQVGQRVAIELDESPGKRFAGEIRFIADAASFTPEKIETRSDRLGQVYRAKVKILEGVESMKPGTEGNVYLVTEAE